MKDHRGKFSTLFPLLICGIGIGLLVGLSTSPVVHIIVGSAMAIAGGLVGALAGLSTAMDEDSITRDSSPNKLTQDIPDEQIEATSSMKSKPLTNQRSKFEIRKVSAIPLTMLILGLVAGALVGIYVRNYDLLAPDPDDFVRKWQGTGLNSQEIQLRLFEKNYPATQKELLSLSDNKSSTNSNTSIITEDSDTSTKEASHEQKSRKDIGNEQQERKTETEKPSQPQEATSMSSSRLFYTGSVDDCNRLRLKEGDQLRTGLTILSNSAVNRKVEGCNGNNSCLEQVRKEICPK